MTRPADMTGKASTAALCTLGFLMLIGATAFIAHRFSPPVAAVFFLAVCGWILLGVWLSGRANPGIEEVDRGAGHRIYRDEPVRPPAHRPAPQHIPVSKPVVEVRRGEKPPPAEPPKMPTTRTYKGEEVVDTRQALVDGIVEITKLIHQTNEKLSRFESIMTKQRLHKTTNDEHRSMISARRIIKALEERKGALQKAVEEFDNGQGDPNESLTLLSSDLVVAHDPLTALPDEVPLPPIRREAFASTLNVLCKQIARKPSFVQVLKHITDR